MVSVPDKPRGIREPPVLLHACKSFAIFCIKPPGSSKRPGVSEVVQLTMLHSCNEEPSSPMFTSTVANDPMLAFRSPAATAVAGTSPTCPISPLANSAAVVVASSSLRLRSQSDCVVNSPVKGILKRRSLLRSYSESHDQTTSMASAAGLTTSAAVAGPCCTSDAAMPHFDCCTFAGDDCECAMSVAAAAIGAKKSVTFSERVEENVFRPGSSILGQRKKNQRKAVAKLRKRKESNGSSCSSLCDIDECTSAEDVDDDNVVVAPDEGPSSECLLDETRNEDNNDERQSTDTTFGADYLEDKEYSPPPPSIDIISIQDNNAVDERRSETDLKVKISRKEKSDAKSAVVAKPPAAAIALNDKYRGFLLAPATAQRPSPTAALDATAVAHALGRLSSVDSALGAELLDDESAVDGLERMSAAGTLTPNSRKDSGVDDDLQLEDLCIRMCEAVVSG